MCSKVRAPEHADVGSNVPTSVRVAIRLQSEQFGTPTATYYNASRMRKEQTTNTGQEAILYWFPVGREAEKCLSAQLTPCFCIGTTNMLDFSGTERRVV
jgi:YD repeat-containing protein